MSLKLDEARKWVAAIWLVWGVGLAFVLAVLTLAGKLDPTLDEPKILWTWFVSMLLPNEGLVLGALAAGAVGRKQVAGRVDSFFAFTTVALSAVYLGTLTITALATMGGREPLGAALEASKLYLGLFQALVTTCLAVFFTRD